MNELTVIHNAEVLGKDFQVYGTADNPLFLAKDVAAWIEHSNHRTMLESVDDDEKCKFIHPVNNPYGGYQEEEQWFLTENGMYEVLMLSRKPIAKQFKQEVKKILREIRTKGGYIASSGEESVEELSLRAMAALQAAIERQKLQIAEQGEQLKLQAPDVDYCREVLSADNLHTANSVSVHLGISAIRLNRFLVDEGWIYKQGGIYYPSCKIRDNGYCDFHVVPYINCDGEKATREHLKWTESGRRAIIALWNKRHNAAKGA